MPELTEEQKKDLALMEQAKADLASKGTEAKEKELTLSTGEVVKWTTEADLLEKVAKMKADTTEAYKTEKQKREELEAQIAAVRATTSTTTAATGPLKMSREQVATYWGFINNQDPVGAANYVDHIRFGLETPEEVVPTITGMKQRTDQLYDRVEIATFQNAAPDFPAGKEASEEIFKVIKRWGTPWDHETLAAAWEVVKKEGKIKPLEVKEEEKPGFTGPPPGSHVGTGAPAATDPTIEAFARMTPEEQVAFMRSKGMNVQV